MALLCTVLALAGAAGLCVPLHRQAGTPDGRPLAANFSISEKVEAIEALPELSLSATAVVHLQNVMNNQYFGLVRIGSNKEQLKVVFDTGSSDLWFPQEIIISDTLEKTDQSAHIQYARGEVDGTIATDTLYIAGVPPLRQAFILIHQEAHMTLVADGIMGLAFAGLSNGEVPLVHGLESVGVHGFSFLLTGEASGSELVFGDALPVHWDVTSKTTYFPVTLGGNYWWSVSANVKVGDKIRFDGVTAIFDTGSSFILIPQHAFTTVVQHIVGSISGCFWILRMLVIVCPCAAIQSAKSLELGLTGEGIYATFHSTIFTLTPNELFRPIPQIPHMCLLEVGMVGDEFPWILGDTFLRTVAIHFDIQNRRVGLATRGKPDYSSSLFLAQQYENGFLHIVVLSFLFTMCFFVTKRNAARTVHQPLLG